MLRKQLFELLRAALWNERPDAKAFAMTDWQAMAELAVEQSVQGLLYDGVMMLDGSGVVTEEAKENCLFLMKNTELRNEKVNLQVSAWFRAYGEKCTTMLLMKGQSIATRYPKPLRRVSGDIDLYCHEPSEVERINAWARRKNVVVEDFYEKHLVFRCNGVSFESHKELILFKSPKLNKAFRDIEEQEYSKLTQCPVVDINGVAVRELPATLYAVYLLAHMAEHFIEEGLGLRQICDWMMFLANDGDRIDRGDFRVYVEALGLMPLANAFGQICVDDLGLDEQHLPFSLIRNAEDYDMVIDTIFKDGNFGRKLYSWKGNVPKWKDMLMTMHVKVPRYTNLYRLWPQEARYCYLDMMARGVKRLSRRDNRK